MIKVGLDECFIDLGGRSGRVEGRISRDRGATLKFGKGGEGRGVPLVTKYWEEHKTLFLTNSL